MPSRRQTPRCESQVDFKKRHIIKKATGTAKYQEDIVTPVSEQTITALAQLAQTSKSGYLFENPHTEKPYLGIKHAFTAALKTAGIADFRFHDLRHTFCTYALIATEDIRSVQVAVGHSNIHQTSKYAHVLEGRKREVIESTGTLISTLVDRNLDNAPKQRYQAAGIAKKKPGSAPVLGTGGRKFESCLPDH